MRTYLATNKFSDGKRIKNLESQRLIALHLPISHALLDAAGDGIMRFNANR